MTYGVDTTEEQDSLLKKHLDLVIEENKFTNLTRIDSIESGQLLHIEDSLVGLTEINDAPEGKYADLGTGGGFPGIPLAIMTNRQTVLVDARKKKIDSLNRIIIQLSLDKSVSTYCGRIEDMANEFPKEFSVITARALSQLSILMELASPLLKQGGQLICYKAHVEETEMNHALKLQKKLGMSLVSRRSLLLSDNETYREIIVFEKIGKPKVKLPRHVGFAQKKPF